LRAVTLPTGGRADAARARSSPAFGDFADQHAGSDLRIAPSGRAARRRLHGRILGMPAARRGPMTRLIASLSAAVFVAAISLSAVAQPKPEPGMPKVDPHSPSGMFGEHGQLAILGEAGALFTHTSVSGRDGSTTTVVFRPGIDYFVIDHLSLGAFSGIEYSGSPFGSTTTYGIGPRVGYDIPFSERFSFWPKVGFSFGSTTLKVDASALGGSSSTSNTALVFNVYAPIMFHMHHYFAGFGPSLDTDLSGNAKATTIAGRLVIGGWLF
jgi:hypothetical protein